MSDNPLVAEEQLQTATAGSGGLVDGIGTTVTSIKDGNWAGGLLGGASAAASAGEVLTDPLGALASAGVGWLMEHVEFLREPLDAVTGDQQALAAMASTWGNVSTAVSDSANDLLKAVEKDTQGWQGAASDSYRQAASTHSSLIGAVSQAAEGASTMIDMCKIVLGVVRDIIRDLISKAVGELIAAALEWAAATAVSLGAATPGMIADLTRRAVSWANKISKWVDKINDVYKNAFAKLDELLERVPKVKKALESVFKNDHSGPGVKIKRPGFAEAGDTVISSGATANLSQTNFSNQAANGAESKMKTYLAGELDSTYSDDE